MTISSGSTWIFDIQVVGRSSGGYSAGYKITGAIDNNSGTGVSFVITTPTTVTLGEDRTDWNATVTAENSALCIKVTGEASTNIRWVATVQTTEVQ